MPRLVLAAASAAILLTTLTAGATDSVPIRNAPYPASPPHYHPGYGPIPRVSPYPGVVVGNNNPAPSPCYPNLDASMYPCPQPNIPAYTGGTTITNSAFSPHEMLYPHRYRALYPPFYYKVKYKNAWWCPLPIPGLTATRTVQKVELMGTQVDVKYHGQISPFCNFFPPN